MTSSLLSFLLGELPALAGEHVDEITNTVKAIREEGREDASQELAARANILSVLVEVCNSSQGARLLPACITILHRLISHAALRADESTLLTTLSLLELSSGNAGSSEEVQLKGLQSIMPLLTHYECHGSTLFKAYEVCFRMVALHSVTVVNAAIAIIRQLIIWLFEKVTEELTSVGEEGPKVDDDGGTGHLDHGDHHILLPVQRASGGLVNLRPFAADAYVVLQDIFLLANDERALVLPMTALNKSFSLELIESVLAYSSVVFNRQTEFAELLKVKLCPMIYRRLATTEAGETPSSGDDFALTCRLWRVAGILMRADFTKAILTSEADAFIAMAARVLEEVRSNWERALAIEFARELFADTATMRSLLLHDLAINRRGDSSITHVIVTLMQATANVSISMITKLSGSSSLSWVAAQLRVPLLQQFEKSRPPPISDIQLLLLSLECTGVMCRLIAGDISSFLSLLQGTWAIMQKPLLLALATCQSMDGEWRAYTLELTSMLVRLLPGIPGPNGSALDITLASLAEMATPQYQQASSSSPSGGTSKSPILGGGSPSSSPSLGSLLVSEQNLAISLCLLQLALDIGEQLGPSWLRIIYVIHANDQFTILKAKRAGGRPGTGTTMTTLSTGGHLERFGEIADLERRIMEQSAQLSLGAFRDFLAALCALLTECIAVETSMPVTTVSSGNPADGSLTSLKMAMVLFPAQKIKQVALLNVNRWTQAEPAELSTVWEMLVHQLVRLTTTTDVPLRGLACETVNLLLTQLAGVMDMTTLDQQPILQVRLFTILERILGEEGGKGHEGEVQDGGVKVRANEHGHMNANANARDQSNGHVGPLSSALDNDGTLRSRHIRPRHCWLDVHRMVLEVLHRLLQQTGPHLTVAWPMVFRLLGTIREQDGTTLALVKGAFISCRLVTSEFLGGLDATCLGLLITLLAGFARTEADLNISLTAIGLLWDVADHIRQRDQGEDEGRQRQQQRKELARVSSEGGGERAVVPEHGLSLAQQPALFDLWIELLKELSKLASDHRPDIRNSAIQTAIRTIDIGAASPHQRPLGGEGSFLSRDRWQSLCERVLWPLLQTLPQVAGWEGEGGEAEKGSEGEDADTDSSGDRDRASDGEPDEENKQGEKRAGEERKGSNDREDDIAMTRRTVLTSRREGGEPLSVDPTRQSGSTSMIGRSTSYIDLTHHSRDSREKQWDETLRYLLEGLTLLFTRYLGILVEISIFGEREWPALQSLLLEHVRRAHSQELVTVAINCLSQLATSGEATAPWQMREIIWRTWREMGLAMAVSASAGCKAHTQGSLLSYIKIFPHLSVSGEAKEEESRTAREPVFKGGDSTVNGSDHCLDGAGISSSSIIARLRESLQAIDGALKCPTPGDPIRDTDTPTELQQRALHLLESHVLREGRGSTVGVRRSIYLDRLATWLSWLPEYEPEGDGNAQSGPSGFTYLAFGLAIIGKIQLRFSDWEFLKADNQPLSDSLRAVIKSLGRIATKRYQLVPPSVSLATGHILWRGATQALNTVLLSLLQGYKSNGRGEDEGTEEEREVPETEETGTGTGTGTEGDKEKQSRVVVVQRSREEQARERTLNGRAMPIDNNVQVSLPSPSSSKREGASSDHDPLAPLWETVVMVLEGQLMAMRSAPLPAALSLEQVEADEEMDVSQVELIRDKLLPLIRQEALVKKVLRGFLRGSRLYTIYGEVDRDGDGEEEEDLDESTVGALPKSDLILGSPSSHSPASPGSAHPPPSSGPRPYSPSVTSVMHITPVLKERVAIACLYSLFAVCHDNRGEVGERPDFIPIEDDCNRDSSKGKSSNDANFAPLPLSLHPIAVESPPPLSSALLVRQIGLSILLGRCQRVLMRYAADRAALGRMPFPRIRQDEIALILKELNHLILPPRVAQNIHGNGMGDDLTRRLLGGSRGHLFFLYPQLVQCMRLNDPTVLGLIQQSFSLIGLELGLM